MTSIICAVDESSGAVDALATSVELADRIDAHLIVAHVHEVDPNTLDEEEIDRVRENAEAVAIDALHRYDAGYIATCVGLIGEVGAQLEELAFDTDSAAIIIGARSRGRAGTTFRSQAARYLSEHSKIPVLIAPTRPRHELPILEPDEDTGEVERTKKRVHKRPVRAWADESQPVRQRPSHRA